METGRGLPATDETDSTQSRGQGCFTSVLQVLDSLKVEWEGEQTHSVLMSAVSDVRGPDDSSRSPGRSLETLVPL